MGNNQERYIAGQTRYARNNPAGVKRSLYGVFRLFCNYNSSIRRFRHLLKLLSFQTSFFWLNIFFHCHIVIFWTELCFILPKYAANIAKYSPMLCIGDGDKANKQEFWAIPQHSAQICASVPKVWHSDKGVGINAFFPHPRNVSEGVNR